MAKHYNAQDDTLKENLLPCKG